MAEDIKFRMTTETKKELEALAKKYNMSVGEVIRQLVKQGMEILKSGDKK
jgi:antitoxin component of RelBE/YafQ-DinJ toxin-antitoxin module